MPVRPHPSSLIPHPFAYTAPAEIRFGWGELRALPAEAARRGRRPLLVTGTTLGRNGTIEPILDQLRTEGLAPVLHAGVPPEPTLAALQAAMDACATAGADTVIAIGGGSVLDIGKAAAALAGTGATAAEYFGGLDLPSTGRPIIALPTTAGTGSEVTRVCVLSDPEHRRKASIRGDSMLPSLAIVDPELTASCPPAVTAHSGMDALVQAIEAHVSRGANPLTDALALEAARLAASALEAAVQDGTDRAAREAMALGSLMAGLALNTARLGLVHGLAHPAGAITGAAHGLLCGLLLPPVMEFNLPVVASRYALLARELGAAPAEMPEPEAAVALIDFIRRLGVRVGIPTRLRDLGLPEELLAYLAAEAMPSGSTQANPRPVTEPDALAVARAAW